MCNGFLRAVCSPVRPPRNREAHRDDHPIGELTCGAADPQRIPSRYECTDDRLHLDLYAPDQAAQVERLIGLGAIPVEDWDGYDDDSDFVVLEDTEGNRFCVVDTSGR